MQTELGLEAIGFLEEGIALWQKRLHDLSTVERFAGIEMIHRTNLDVHTARIVILTIIAKQAMQSRGITINGRHAVDLAKVHDDPEVITKDIPSTVKSAMTEAERQKLHKQEETATIALARQYMPRMFQDFYIGLWREAKSKLTPESQVVDIADKWDGICEAIHEIRCGNDDFLQVLERYRSLVLPHLENYDSWQVISEHPKIQLSNVPTAQEAQRLPKISLDTYRLHGAQIFWEEVMDPNVPEFYKRWIKTTFTCGLDLDVPGTPLFPDWAKELGPQDLKDYFPILHRGRIVKLN
ncbi:HD domain-containing protein [Candidatus Woesebacteria bacterium]|nr:HD domain-containing protein [Candidatus Woesebacteria bacterium]